MHTYMVRRLLAANELTCWVRAAMMVVRNVAKRNESEYRCNSNVAVV
ncbi:MAG: hypothetical protein H0T92_08580 [Pyrinomonadaceae bacterium]|nr:hypothetical protein [Pyrinomonadaceae bacterium]